MVPDVPRDRTANSGDDAATRTGTGPGERLVSPAGIILALILTLLAAAALFYLLIRLWPDPASIPSQLTIGNVTLHEEQRLLLLVLVSGALGGIVHGLRSLVWYIGNRELRLSWLPLYVSFPFAGAILAWVFYVVIRGGFFAPGAAPQDTSPFAFVAVAALVGLFSTSAVLKLKEIAETVFMRPPTGRDAVPQGVEGETGEPGSGAVPVIERIERLRRAEGAAEDALAVHGSGFAERCALEVNGRTRGLARTNDKQLRLLLTSDDDRILGAGGDFVISVINPSGARSAPFDAAET